LSVIFCYIHEIVSDDPVVTQITDPVDHSEEPTWDPTKNILFYVDIHTGRVFSYNYNTSALNFIKLYGEVTPVIPSQKNSNLLIVGLNRSVVAVEWDGTGPLGKQKILASVNKQFPNSRMNDGKADKQGRLWIGTMESGGDSHGVFYKITKENLDNPTVEIASVNISNGLAWNAANNKFYYIDSPSLQVAEYDYDDAKGTISNRRVAFDLTKYPELSGVPDGMTIDENDNLWVALYGGSSVIQVNPKTGALLKKSSHSSQRYYFYYVWRTKSRRTVRHYFKSKPFPPRKSTVPQSRKRIQDYQPWS